MSIDQQPLLPARVGPANRRRGVARQRTAQAAELEPSRPGGAEGDSERGQGPRQMPAMDVKEDTQPVRPRQRARAAREGERLRREGPRRPAARVATLRAVPATRSPAGASSASNQVQATTNAATIDAADVARQRHAGAYGAPAKPSCLT